MSIIQSIVQPIIRPIVDSPLWSEADGDVAVYLQRLLYDSTAIRDDGITIADVSTAGTDRDLQPGRCLDFNGTDQYVDCGDDDAFDLTSSLAVSAWAKNENAALSGSECIVTKYSTTDNKREWQLQFDTNEKLALILSDDGSTFEKWESTNAVALDELNHIAFNFVGGDSLTVYLNGAELAGSFTTGSLPASLNNDDAPLWIGALRDSGSAANLFEGLIFDVQIFESLTADEITAIYRQGLQPHQIVPGQLSADNLVGRWLLDDNSETTAYDSSGNGNDGTIQNYAAGLIYEGIDVPYSWANLVGYSDGASNVIVPRDESDTTKDVLGNALDYSGIAPRDAELINSPCLDFNGTDQYVEIADDTAFDLSTTLSVSIWAKSDLSDIVSTNDFVFSKYNTITNKREWAIAFSTAEKLMIFLSSNGTDFNQWDSDDAVTINQWNAIQFVYVGGTSLTVYLNGVEIAGSFTSGSLPASLNNDDQPINIGSYNSATAGTWNGKLFDARIYDTALSATDIAAIYAGEEIDTDPVFWMPMSEGDGGTTYDVSGNGNHGTIENYVSTMWTNADQDLFHYNVRYGCTVDSGVSIPALLDGSAAANDAAITGPANTLNNSDTQINFIPEADAPYIRGCIPGATFDGVGDYVDVGSISTDAIQSFKFECVFKYDSIPSVRSILCSIWGDGSNDRQFWVAVTASGQINVQWSNDGTNQPSNSTFSNVLSADEFASYEITYDSTGDIEIKKNGIDDYASGVQTGTGTIFNQSPEPLVIGRRGDTANWFDGTIQYQKLTINGIVIFEYDFRENNGLIIPDRSGNGNDGTLVVNSSLAEIFAYETPVEDYTLDDGRNRPHYYTDETNYEHQFRTEL
jgi:hypothetical protein